MVDERALRRSAAYRVLRGTWREPAGLACSGGTDSSALLALAGVAVRHGDVGPFVAVYVDHGTRPETTAEAQHVASLAERFDVPFVAVRVRDEPAGSGQSPEERLRQLRYQALASVVREKSLSCVVTAHTSDDQLETVLMRLFSGAHGCASTGMRPRQQILAGGHRLEVVRPMLAISRAELCRVLEMLDVTPVDDPTNADIRFRRNAVRHRIIPEITAAFPGFDGPLLRAVALAARDAGLVDTLADELYGRIAVHRLDEVALSRAELRHMHPAIGSRVIRYAARSLVQGDQRELTFERVQAVLDAVPRRSGAVIQLPYGVTATIERDVVRLTRSGVVEDADRS